MENNNEIKTYSYNSPQAQEPEKINGEFPSIKPFLQNGAYDNQNGGVPYQHR
jgi:hypothetical protein